LTKPLYKAIKRGEQEHLIWGEEQEKAFRGIKRVFTNAPALGLLDVMKPFFLCVHEQKGTAVRDLTQLLNSWHHLVSYLSKQLIAVARGWLPCLHTLAATTVQMAEADKLVLGQELTV
jgi:hypothetical protein